MILILSTSKFESTTDEVIRWLNYYKADWKRLNGYDLQNGHSFFDRTTMQINSKELSTELCPVIWYRRWYEQDAFAESIQEAPLIKNKGELKQHLAKEFEALSEVMYHRLADSFWLTNPLHINVNKLVVLEKAQQMGLLTPDTSVLSAKRDLETILLKHNRLVTKALTNSPDFFATDDVHEYASYTEEVNFEDLASLPDTFFPTLFQKAIDKAYEVRVFYLDGLCYSMAIFSQRNSKTKVDFRHYDHELPNRTVPYQLPKDVEAKIHALMQHLKLNSGSLDFIVEANIHQYYFLEVNPVGQFGMVSIPCNYYLEKKIATLLILKQRLHEKSPLRSAEKTYQAAT